MDIDSDANYDNLKPQKIVDTIRLLQQRIADRFPDSGLYQVCGKLHHISENMKKRAEWIGRPVFWLRILTWIICAAITAIVASFFIGSADSLHLTDQKDAESFVVVLEPAVNVVVLIGAAIIFFLTLETRYKRQRALKAIHELRTVAHVIDMHQLTKDPHRLKSSRVYSSTDYSPKMTMTTFQLHRYLDYCSEMLSLTGKIAAVYVQEFDDGVALASASELENLTTGLSRKIWQKISILNMDEMEDNQSSKIHTP